MPAIEHFTYQRPENTVSFFAPNITPIEAGRDIMRRKPVRVESELAPLELDLSGEVRKIHLKGEEKLYMLPGTGFHVTAEIENLLRNVEKGLPLADSFAQVEQNIQGFKVEYLVEGPVFPIVLEKKMHEGKLRLVGKLYGGGLWLDAVSSDERDGAVREVVRKLEEDIIYGNRGDLFVMQSPKGWSGYQMRGDILEKENEGDVLSGAAKKVKYQDTQTYCIQVQPDGSVRGFTLKSNMNLSQNEALLTHLGVTADTFYENTDEETGIKRIVQHAVKIDSKEGKSIEDIAQNITRITGSEFLYRDTVGRAHTVSEMMALLKNPEHLWTLDDTVQGLIDEWKMYATGLLKNFNDTTEMDLKISLGLTVMKLMHKLRPPVLKREMTKGVVHGIVDDRLRPVFNPRDSLEKMQRLPGCAGGGTNSGIVDSAGMPRSMTTNGMLSAEDAKKDPNLCRCTVGGGENSPHFHCEGKKKSGEGNEKCNHAIVVGKGISRCPSCGEGRKC